MHYSAKRGLAISHVSVRPSVSLSVTLVDHDHIGWKSWKLIVRTISPTYSLFVAQRSSTYSQGTWRNFGETRGGVGKVACRDTKAAISLKCVKIAEKLLWEPIGSYQCSFEWYHPRPPMTSSSPRLWFTTPNQNSNRAGTAKATHFNFSIHIQELSGHSYIRRIARSSLR